MFCIIPNFKTDCEIVKRTITSHINTISDQQFDEFLNMEKKTRSLFYLNFGLLLLFSVGCLANVGKLTIKLFTLLDEGRLLKSYNLTIFD